MNSPLKVMTVVGTRPEIIRLSRVVAAIDEWTEHVLVHTGQNYDYQLNEVFFEDLGMRRPDHFLEADTTSLGSVLGDVLLGTERVLHEERPDALIILGDTNSSIAAIMGRRMKVPVYHLEAGNRSFDANVPEEINRIMVDHVSDYNFAYSEHSRRNLLSEGLHPSRVFVMGSPMREVLQYYETQTATSDVMQRLKLKTGQFLVASFHREENVDSKTRLTQLVAALSGVADAEGIPVLVSTHPRTKQRLDRFGLMNQKSLRFHAPMGFHDYITLQKNAKCVISDSGTISEESCLLGFPAVTIRDAIERPEAVETGSIITTGLAPKDVMDAVRLTIEQHQELGPPMLPNDYSYSDCSRRVLNVIRSTAGTHHLRLGIRRDSPPANVSAAQPRAMCTQEQK